MTDGWMDRQIEGGINNIPIPFFFFFLKSMGIKRMH